MFLGGREAAQQMLDMVAWWQSASQGVGPSILSSHDGGHIVMKLIAGGIQAELD